MKIPYYHIDAFSAVPYRGNPAGVCPLPEWLPDRVMQNIAMENQLAETAFFVPEGTGAWHLRWFTPSIEIDLCGHATLATAHVLRNELGEKSERLRFRSLSGELAVDVDGDDLALDFPARPAEPVEVGAVVAQALGVPVEKAFLARDLMIVLPREEDVRAVRPDFNALQRLPYKSVMITAPSAREDVDFVSRFFAPAIGVPEDAVTGSAHCTLVPYWAERLGKTILEARQLSSRGGAVRCTLTGDRVRLAGGCYTFARGEIEIP